MALDSGFFNSVNGDRLYDARDMSRYFENILSSGIFKRIPNCFKVSAGAGMTLTVAPGAGLIDSQWFRAAVVESVTIPTANAVLPRVDSVVARLNLNDDVRAITLMVVQGAPGDAPVAVAPTRTTNVQDLVLARVYVPAGATEILPGNITDTRADEAICGYVRSLVDTPVLKTYNARYEAPADDTTTAPISIVGFNKDLDILNVYINGFRIAPGIEYSVSDDSASITLTEAVDAGTLIDFEAARPIMPDDVTSYSDTITDLLTHTTEQAARLTLTNNNSENAVAEVEALKSRVTELEQDSGWLDIPWENGVSSNANWTARLRRVGKSIFLRGLCTGITANELRVATIPEGFRPTMGGHAYASFCSSNTGTNTRAARMFINTDGEVIFRSAGNAVPASTDVVTISTSWLID